MDPNGRYTDQTGVLRLYELEDAQQAGREAALDALIEVALEVEPGPDWFTAAEISERSGIPHRVAYGQLQRAVKAGQIETMKYKRTNYYKRR